MNGTETILSVESAFDGSEAQFGTSKATLSADGKVLTVVNDYTSSAGGQTVGKSTETWTHK
jgi:hypothetical protein